MFAGTENLKWMSRLLISAILQVKPGIHMPSYLRQTISIRWLPKRML